MRVVKKINNNVAICMDDHDHELIAFGKGIGFPNIPYVLKDLSVIDRTFYGTDAAYFNLLNEIPSDVFEMAANIIDYANSKIMVELNPNIIFTLADHIHFAIQRYEKHMVLRMPIGMDIQHLYEKKWMSVRKALLISIR